MDSNTDDLKLSYDKVELYTDNFSHKNFIGKFQWGRLFHGLIGTKLVVVKKWEDPLIYIYYKGDNAERLKDEVFLFEKHPEVSSHPNLGKLIGYCNDSEKEQAAVYDIQAVDIVDNLVLKDNFTWRQRIKVIFGFARALEFLHAQTPLPCLLRNVSAIHVLVDKDFNAKLFDFGMVTGGVFSDRRSMPKPHVFGCHAYVNFDPRGPGGWSNKVDVMNFGNVLLMLLAKRVIAIFDEAENDYVIAYEWARDVYKRRKCKSSEFTLVHKSLQQDVDFEDSDGDRIERLAMRCVEHSVDRCNMKTVLKELLKLKVIKDMIDEKELASLKRYLTVTSRVS